MNCGIIIYSTVGTVFKRPTHVFASLIQQQSDIFYRIVEIVLICLKPRVLTKTARRVSRRKERNVFD